MHEEEPSLLSHLNEVRSRHLPEGGLSTVIYCGKVRSEGDLSEALQIHRIFVEEEVNQEEVNVTGILVGQGNSVLHLLEGPSFSVLKILHNLANHEHFIRDGVQSGSIVFNVENRPKRYFPEWYSCTIQERKSAADDVTEENCKDIVYEMATKLLGVGDGLQNEVQEELDISRYADQLPGKSTIIALSGSSYMFSLQDYVDFYFEPYHIELESEQTWPLERLVTY